MAAQTGRATTSNVQPGAAMSNQVLEMQSKVIGFDLAERTSQGMVRPSAFGNADFNQDRGSEYVENEDRATWMPYEGRSPSEIERMEADDIAMHAGLGLVDDNRLPSEMEVQYADNDQDLRSDPTFQSGAIADSFVDRYSTTTEERRQETEKRIVNLPAVAGKMDGPQAIEQTNSVVVMENVDAA